jgi:hypothetical protein
MGHPTHPHGRSTAIAPGSLAEQIFEEFTGRLDGAGLGHLDELTILIALIGDRFSALQDSEINPLMNRKDWADDVLRSIKEQLDDQDDNGRRFRTMWWPGD